jgi:thiamine phosphate synthase YjbQ (UPF0047 family)
MHITAGVYVNDAEDGLIQDLDEWLERLAPTRPDYRHHRTGEINADAHLKSLLIHHEVIYYTEFDGQQPKRVTIKVMGEWLFSRTERRCGEPDMQSNTSISAPF